MGFTKRHSLGSCPPLGATVLNKACEMIKKIKLWLESKSEKNSHADIPLILEMVLQPGVQLNKE